MSWLPKTRGRSDTADSAAAGRKDSKQQKSKDDTNSTRPPQAAAGSSSTGRNKKERPQDQQTAMETVIKASLNHEQQLRNINADTFDFYLIKTDCKPVKAAKQAGEDYNTAVKEAGKDHSYGSPHAGIAVAFLKAMHEDATTAGKAVLQQAILYAESRNQDAFIDLIPFFLVKDAYYPDKDNKQDKLTKLTFCINALAVQDEPEGEENVDMNDDPAMMPAPTFFRTAMKTELKRTYKAENKPGRAPRSALERQLQAHLKVAQNV